MQAVEGAALVSRILTGDHTAEDELVRRYAPGVSVIVRQSIGNRPAVEDVSQDALALVIAKIRGGEVREPERLSGFIAALARNLAIAYRRKSARGETAGEIEASDAHGGPLAEFLRQERAEAVRQVLREMNPARDRQLLHRFYIAEEPKESICAELGLSSLHFNRVLHRARQRFREIYDKKAH